MRIRMAVILLFSVCSAGLAEQLPCRVPVNVVVPDLSSLPKPAADAMVAEWKQHFQEMREHRRDWSWQVDWGLFGSVGRPGSCLPPDCASVANLSAEGFVARDKNGPVRVRSATYDRGPRRIVFVVENAKKMPVAARKIEAAVISHILAKARPQDSFALLTARGPGLALRFGSSRDAIRAAAEQLGNPPQGEPGGEGVLDAVLEATTWFQQPQPGDSIIVMALRLEGKHNASFSDLRAAVTAGRIRVFGFQLGEYSYEDLGRGRTFESWDVQDFGRSVLFDWIRALAEATGGALVLENTEEGKQYKLTDDRLKGLQVGGEMIYKAITEFYLLQLERTGPHVVIALAPPVLEQLPWASVVYPKSLPPSSSTTAATPARTETPR